MPGSDLPHLPRSPFDLAEDWKTAREYSQSLQTQQVVACDVCDGHKASYILTDVRIFAFSRNLASRRSSMVGGYRTQQGGHKSLGTHNQG
jgi:hypothetical protein